MDKENGDRSKSKPGDPNPLLDPLNVFAGHSIFGSGGGLGAGYGHPLTNAYSVMMGGGRSGQFPPAPHPPTTNAYGSLGTLSVAASQAASLGINSASAAWWTMASHLAAQDYLARLQAAGIPFPGMSPEMLQSFPLMSPQHAQGGSKQAQSAHTKSSLSHGHMGMSSHHHREPNPPQHKDHQGSYRAKVSPGSQSHSQNKAAQSRGSTSSSAQASHQAIGNLHAQRDGSSSRDPGSVLGGVRLPPDTEIIKYTSSIVGPKVPGTTNRGRKKTISLDPPSVSVTPTIASSAVNMDRIRKNKHLEEPPHLQHSPLLMASREPPDLTELLSLTSGVTNGQDTPLSSPVLPMDNDAPLNLSLKPAPSTPQTANNALQSLSSLSQSLGNMPERISRRKPGPKPRRVTPSPLPPPGPSPSASLVQLFAAAADVPRPSSVEDTADLSTHHKDGRPRNLGRGVSKPKKNTVASLLAQSRALGIKPGIDFNSPLGNQVSLLQANLLQQSSEGESETEFKCKPTSPEPVAEQIEKDKKYLEEKMKNDDEMMSVAKINYNEIISRALSPDANSESDYESDDSTNNKKQNDYTGQGTGGMFSRKRKLNLLDEDLRIPMEKGWKRETVVKGFDQQAKIQGDVVYVAPCGKVLKHMGELMQYLVQNNIEEVSKFNFWFGSDANVGDFILSVDGQNPRKMSESEMKIFRSELKKGLRALESLTMEAEGSKVSDKDKASFASNEDKKVLKEEAARNKELTRFIKEQEKSEKQEAMKKEREQRNIQMLEARRKRQEEAGKLRQEEQLRKQQEREMKRQQTALLKEQIYMQELSTQREVLYTVELERERRRQHMALVKSLEVRKKHEEREKRRLEIKAEKMASREKRIEQRRIEMDLLSEIRKPVEDMELPDLKPLPELERITGLKLSGQAFSDAIMVFEFLHNFGETLGFDMGSLPTLNSLQNALLGDEEAEEELLSVMTHLIICAIEDPGIPNPARHTTLLGQSLKQADITHANISEILRIYLYANATGEVKALTGVQFEREREKRLSDHHNNMTESTNEESETGKNAAFFVALRENTTWRMSEILKHKPFLALNATAKAKILQFLCNELLQNKAVIRQVENAIETVAQLKRDRWTNDSKLRKLRHLHNRKLRQMTVGMMGGKLSLEGVDDETAPPKDHDDDDEGDGESENESEGTQPEEEEDKNLSVEEMARKLEKLHRQAEQTLSSLAESGGQLRAVCYGQDRYWRRYWSLPTAGGLFVEGMESAEPDLFEELLQQDDADSMETPDIKGEYDAEALQCKNMPMNDDDDDDDDEMPLLTPEVDTATLLSKYKEEEHMDDDSAPLPMIQLCNEELESKGMLKLYKEEPESTRVIKVRKDILESNGNQEEGEEGDKGIKEDEATASQEEEKLMNDYFGGKGDVKEKLKLEDQKLSEDAKTGEDDNIANGQVESAEPAWFSILPREPCDNTSVTSTASAFRCGSENSELRIPVFPPPPASPSPSQCDSPSPAPLAITPEEHAQLLHCKVHGLPTPASPKPIPYDLRCGWWRITDTAVLQQLVENLHTRGTREKDLRRNITKLCVDQNWTSMLKMCVRPGSSATELLVNPDDVGLPQTIPARDSPDTWNYSAALRVDMAVLEQVEVMEDKVANASMQIKGWKVPPRASTAEGRVFQPSSSHPSCHLNPVTVAKERLLDLENAIERRYLKPPLGINVTPVDVSLSGSTSSELDTIPKGLVVWRDAVAKSQTAAQLSMGLHMLEASIAWDKSIMKANCQFCHSGDNEDKLLLCDGCDKGYHTYCFKPRMENIPEGDWFCVECMNKATGEKCCIVCGKKQGRNLMICDNCPKAYHTDCLQPPISKVPRGKWHCPACFAKLPRKRLITKRTLSSSTSPSSSLNRSVDDGSCSNAEAFLSSPMAVDEAPDSPPPMQPLFRKEKIMGKKLAREMAPCRHILDEMESHDDAWPFLLPVNTKQFPTYKKIIKNPMDISTVRKRLMDSVYKSRDEFCSDVRLIFNNCETFNEDDSPVGKAGHQMRLFFETRWVELS